MRVWSRLDRYLASQLQGTFWLALSAFTLIFLLNALFRLARETIEKQVPLRLVVGFLLAELPEIFLTTIPIASLVTVLVVTGRLSVQHETLALRASGVRPARIFRPILAVASLGFLASLGMAHFLIPEAEVYERSLVREIIRSRDLGREIDAGVFYDRLADAVLYTERAVDSPEGRVFEGVFLYREAPDGSRATLILAKRGAADFDRESGQISLNLDEGEQHLWEIGDPAVYNIARFPRLTLNFPPDPSFQISTRSKAWRAGEFQGLDLYSEMASLRRTIESSEEPGIVLAAEGRLRRAQVEWHHRLALPAAVLVLAFAAFPLAYRTLRGGRFAGLTQALLIIVVFNFLHEWARGLAADGVWPAWLGLWLANLIVLVWGVLLWSLGAPEARPPLLAALSGPLRRASRILGRRSGARRQEGPGTGASSRRHTGRRAGLTTLDVYLGRAYLKMFGAIVVVLLSLIAVFEFRRAFSRLDDSFTSLPLGEIARYVAFALPEQLNVILPLAALAAAGISLGGLARSGELTAFKASGIGPVRIAAPLLAVTLVMCITFAFAQESVLPAAAREARQTYDFLRGRVAADIPDTGRRWIVGEDGKLWAYLDWQGAAQGLSRPGVFRLDLEEARLEEHVEAERAGFEASSWFFRGGGWRRIFLPGGSTRFEPFEELASSIGDSPELFGAHRAGLILGRSLTDQLTVKELWEFTNRMRKAAQDVSPYEVGLYQKLVTPGVGFLLVLVGVPLIVSGWARKGSLYGFGISMVITLVFWALWAVSTSLGREGVVSAPIAAFVAPSLLLVLGIFLLGRAR